MSNPLLGVLAGATWNLASVWCLIQLLQAWLGPHPSRRRALLWLLVKFPLLYLLVFVLLRHPAISVVGFGVGFSLVLLIVVGWLLRQAALLRAVRFGEAAPAKLQRSRAALLRAVRFGEAAPAKLQRSRAALLRAARFGAAAAAKLQRSRAAQMSPTRPHGR